MKAYGLFREGASTPDLWMCGACHRASATQAYAQRCCLCRWPDCPETPPAFLTFCPEHDKANREKNERIEREKESARFARAKKITVSEYTGGMVYCDAMRGGDDGYFEDVDHVLDNCEVGEEPEYVWACTRHKADTDAGRLIEAALENTADDAYEHFGKRPEEVARLQAMLDAWWADNEFVWFETDYKVAILVPQADVTNETEASDAAE